MKFNDIWEEGNITKEAQELYERLMEILNQCEELQKSQAEEQGDGAQDEELDAAKDNLVQCIVDIVRKEEKKFDFSRIEKLYGDDDFWEEIKEEVDRITCDYLRAGKFRQFDDDLRRKCFQTIFEMIYFEGEIPKYAAENLQIEMDEAKLLFYILSYSETFILIRGLSKRIFRSNILKKYGLSESDSDLIWELFQVNKEKIENIVLRRHLLEMDYKMSRICTRLKNLEDMCDLALDIFLDKEDEEDSC